MKLLSLFLLIILQTHLIIVPPVDAGKVRSTKARNHFMKLNPCPSTGLTKGKCPGYIIDHIIPIKRGGRDCPLNMQWQTLEDSRAKDRAE